MAPIMYLAKTKETIYALVPSLEQIAAVKIATTLWNRADIRALIDQCELFGRNDEYSTRIEPELVQDKVKCYAEKLLLSEEARNRVLGVVEPIGEQIFSWRNFFNCGDRLPKQLFFTAFGTIDHDKIAQTIVNDNSVCLKLRYMFACTCCLEDEVIRLWEELPAESRDVFIGKEWHRTSGIERVVGFWSRAMQQSGDLQERFEKLGVSSEYCLAMPSYSGYIPAAVKYFLPKLNDWAKGVVFRHVITELTSSWCNSIQDNCKNEFFFWFFSQMEEGWQTVLFDKAIFHLLLLFLDWPWQGLFLCIANHLKPYLSDTNFSSLLYNIVWKSKEVHRNYDYQQLLTEFWAMCPETAKREVMKKFASNCGLLCDLFSLGDMNNVQLILKDATDEETKKIICCLASFYHRPQDAYRNVENTRQMSLLLLEYVIGEELNKQRGESGPLCKKCLTAC